MYSNTINIHNIITGMLIVVAIILNILYVLFLFFIRRYEQGGSRCPLLHNFCKVTKKI